ncbi:MAG: hypothetical protein KKA73_11360 [Chloroflexi bacterium]|nr:hypothetical protein [Chloroflexota bacterium]MBU1748276.1 hypothetical protein [Chloroflexota bacterium]
MLSRFSLHSLLAALFDRRRGSGVSLLLLLAGLFACLTGCPAAVCGVPYGVTRSLEAMLAVARPTPAQLHALPPGTRVIIAAQLSRDAVDPPGLALFYTETRPARAADDPATATSYAWQPEAPPPPRVVMQLADGSSLTVQMPAQPQFLNAQQLDAATPALGRRYVGYLPGQTLAVEGVWESRDLLTARALYAGSVNDYLTHLAYQPGTMLLMGMGCSGMGLLLLLMGAMLRVLGK